jgi:hypothetical protein
MCLRELKMALARGLGRRLKVAGHGWRADHLEGMVTLIATSATSKWAGLWARPAA